MKQALIIAKTIAEIAIAAKAAPATDETVNCLLRAAAKILYLASVHMFEDFPAMNALALRRASNMAILEARHSLKDRPEILETLDKALGKEDSTLATYEEEIVPLVDASLEVGVNAKGGKA